MPVVTATITSAGQSMDPMFEWVTIDIAKEAGRIPWAMVTLLDGNAMTQTFEISDDGFFEPGKIIEIKLRYEDDPSGEASVFKGMVVRQTVEAGDHGTLLTVEMKDEAIKLTRCRKSRVYTDTKDSDVFAELIGNGGLKKGTLDATEPVYPELVQYACTDWDFMLSRADVYGNLVIAEAGEISVRKIDVTESPKQTFEFGISEVYGFEMEADGSHQIGNVESVAWDIKTQKLTQATKAKAFTLNQGNLDAEALAKAMGGDLKRLSSAVSLDPKTLSSWADGTLVKSRLAMLRGSLSVSGTGDLSVLDVIEVKGVGKRFNGTTAVTGIRHRVDANGWVSHVQFGLPADRFIDKPDIMDRPAAGLLPGVNGLQIGVVVSHEDDPDELWRVKVSLPGMGEEKNEIWARQAVPDAGNERGFFFRPEVGDEVIVGFLNDDPRQAVILGAMFNPLNVPPAAFADNSQDNAARGVVSRAGTALTFMDGDKPSFSITTPGENTVTLDDDGELIELSDKHGNTITMDKDGITLKSAKDLKIDASGNVEIKGAKVDMK